MEEQGTGSLPDHLRKDIPRPRWPRHDHTVDVGYIGALCEDRYSNLSVIVLNGAEKESTAVDQHGVLPSSESLHKCLALNSRGACMEIACIDPRITECSG